MKTKRRAPEPIVIQPTSFKIPADLLRQAKHQAIDEQCSVQDLVVKALRRLLEEEGK